MISQAKLSHEIQGYQGCDQHGDEQKYKTKPKIINTRPCADGMKIKLKSKPQNAGRAMNY